MTSAHELLQTRTCTTQGCVADADGHDGLCREHRLHPPRPLMTREEFQAAERGEPMTKCKRDGCVRQAVGKASFAGLCRHHITEEAARRQNDRKRTGGGNVSTPRTPVVAPAEPAAAAPSTNGHVALLADLGAAVDQARQALREAEQQVEVALAALREAIQ